MMLNNTSLKYLVYPLVRDQSLIFILFWLSIMHFFCFGCGRESDERGQEVGHLPLLHPTQDTKLFYPQDMNKTFLPLQQERIIAEPLLPYPVKIQDFE
jgi:hypothetical protein